MATRLFTMLLCLALAGCAAQLAYRDGVTFAEQDRIEQSLEKFQEAIKHDPGNAQYRQALLQTRERAAYRLLEQAERDMAAGGHEMAGQLYRRVLAVDPNNQRARAGIDKIAATMRHAQWLKEGRAALEQRDLAGARTSLGKVQAENPLHPDALALQREIQQKAVPPPDTLLSAAYRKAITIEFRDATLRQVFDVIAHSSGLNFIFDKDVRLDQRTSVFLRNSTVEAAVHYTLLTNQLEEQVLDGNTVLIFPNTTAKQNDYKEMVVRSFFLANADAKNVGASIRTLLKSRDVVTDEKLNMVIVRDSPAAIKLAEKLVALQDLPEPEVMLEVEILEVKRTRELELGIQWPSSLGLVPLAGSPSVGLTLANLRSLNSTNIGAAIGPTTINARADSGDVNLLANPRIRARNREKASVMIGDRVPNITTTVTATGFVSESVNYQDVGLKLEVEPQVHLNDDVTIRVKLEVSNIVDQTKTENGTVAYQIGTRNAGTVLRLKDGETQVLAGLINDEDRRSANKIPLLGDLPLVGRLFGNQLSKGEKTEIVLSITPRLVRNIQRPDADAMEFRSGTASTLRGRPDTLPSGNAAPRALPAGAGGASGSADSPLPPPTRTLNANTGTSTAPSGRSMGLEPTAAGAGQTGASLGAPGMPGVIAVRSSAVQWQWQGPRDVKVGDTFTLGLTMQSTQPVQSTPMTITFDDQAFQLVRVAEGDFLRQGGASSAFTSRVAGGVITLNDVRAGTAGATGSGTTAVLTLRALAASDKASVQLSAATPTDSGGKSVPRQLPAPILIKVGR